MNKFECKLLEKYLANDDFLFVGVDEVGRGCLAGPIVVSAVILPNNYYNPLIKDSKKLSAKQREILFTEINQIALDISIIIVDVRLVETLNPKKASIYGMEQAINNLSTKPKVVLTDAEKIITNYPQINLIKGDMLSQTIAAASIIAKVTRDNLMKKYHNQYPHYKFEKNKGYGTKEHLLALTKYGYCDEHRKTYAPIKKMIK